MKDIKKLLKLYVIINYNKIKLILPWCVHTSHFYVVSSTRDSSAFLIQSADSRTISNLKFTREN